MTRFATPFVGVVALLCATTCAPTPPHDEHLMGDVWTVTSEWDFLMSSEGTDIESGSFAVWEEYGQECSNGERTIYLLATNTPWNPYDLSPGERFRITIPLERVPFSEFLGGYYLDPENIEKMRL